MKDSMKKYESYKQTNLDWIGSIPNHWKFSRVGRHFFLERGRVISKGEIADNIGEFPVYSSQTKNNGELGKINTYDFDGEYVTWTTDGANTGTCFYRKGKFNTTNVCGMLSPKNIEFNLRYLNYFLNTVTKPYVRIDINPKLMNEMMADIPIIIPTNPEQSQIVSYLDRKTALIDSLIEKTERKIALLKEKRTALINQAVTKGLDPNVKMKNSGVEWIGEIPEHWELAKLKYHGDVIIGLSYKPENISEPENGTLVMRSSNIQNGIAVFNDNVFVDAEIPSKLWTQKGDILICSRNGSRKLIGKNCLIDESSEGLTWGVFMTVFRSKTPYFFHWLLNSPVFESQSGLFLTSTINQLTVSTLQNMVVPFTANKEEQNAIVKFLEKETKVIDETISIEIQKTQKLKEYRQALISEVVTGKIKVTEDV